MPLVPCAEPGASWRFHDPRSGDSLALVPERGGLVTGWTCGGRPMLYFDAERFADPAASVRGGIPVLFPICGGLSGGTLPLPQGSFPMPQHGFARNRPWSLAALPAGDGVALELHDDAETLRHFPFPFSLTLELRLEPSALAITARLRHRGETGDPPLPFSLGLHPYFAVGDPAAVRIEGLPPRCLDHTTGDQSETAGQLARLGGGVDLLCHPPGVVRLVDPSEGVAVRLETRAPMDLVVVWTDPPRPMVCLEPWTAPRGALVSGDRRLVLAPGESLELGCRYVVEGGDPPPAGAG